MFGLIALLGKLYRGDLLFDDDCRLEQIVFSCGFRSLRMTVPEGDVGQKNVSETPFIYFL